MGKSWTDSLKRRWQALSPAERANWKYLAIAMTIVSLLTWHKASHTTDSEQFPYNINETPF